MMQHSKFACLQHIPRSKNEHLTSSSRVKLFISSATVSWFHKCESLMDEKSIGVNGETENKWMPRIVHKLDDLFMVLLQVAPVSRPFRPNGWFCKMSRTDTEIFKNAIFKYCGKWHRQFAINHCISINKTMHLFHGQTLANRTKPGPSFEL